MSEVYNLKSDGEEVAISKFIDRLLDKESDQYEQISRDTLIFEAGIFEAVKRFVKATDSANYVDKRILVALIGMKEDEDE